jgi:hypothetical protein
MAISSMPSKPPTKQPDPPPSKPPFDVPRFAVLLLAVLVVTGCVISLVVAVRCVVWPNQYCADRNWGVVVRDWLNETIPVLVAIAMGWRNQPPPPRE